MCGIATAPDGMIWACCSRHFTHLTLVGVGDIVQVEQLRSVGFQFGVDLAHGLLVHRPGDNPVAEERVGRRSLGPQALTLSVGHLFGLKVRVNSQ